MDYKLYVVTQEGEEREISYKPYEYNNLMELVVNELWEDWGDCMGRAICGTCHIEILGAYHAEPEQFEEHTISLLPNKKAKSRLACQITPDKRVNNMRFRILKDFD